MNHQVLTIWVAGLMIGTGSGLIIARSLPKAVQSGSDTRLSQQEQSSLDRETTSGLYPDFLADPRQHLGHDPLATRRVPESVSSSNQEQPERQTFEPRLLPEGDASPVQSEQSEVSVQKPTSTEFQNELKEIAPEFTEKTLNDLATIRSQIENEKQ